MAQVSDVSVVHGNTLPATIVNGFHRIRISPSGVPLDLVLSPGPLNVPNVHVVIGVGHEAGNLIQGDRDEVPSGLVHQHREQPIREERLVRNLIAFDAEQHGLVVRVVQSLLHTGLVNVRERHSSSEDVGVAQLCPTLEQRMGVHEFTQLGAHQLERGKIQSIFEIGVTEFTDSLPSHVLDLE